MVGISGAKSRKIELFRDEKGNEVLVFGGWEKWKDYYERYQLMHKFFPEVFNTPVTPEYQWQWKQNYPELVVKDVLRVFEDTLDPLIESFMYADLLYRGINKWLFVRYLLIRYKKMVADWRNDAYEKYKHFEKWRWLYHRRVRNGGSVVGLDVRNAYNYGYWKGYYDAMMRVRADLKNLCNTPRYVVWNGSTPGFVVDKKISRGWLNLVKKLYDVRFEK